MQTFEVKQNSKLLEFIKATLQISSNRAKQLLDSRVVFVNNRRIWMARHNLKRGDSVKITSTLMHQPTTPVTLYQDEFIIIVDKPAGLISIGGKDNLEKIIQKREANPQIKVAHRLDRDTSGCLILTKSKKAQLAFDILFRQRKIYKEYLATVAGHIKPPTGNIDLPLEGKPCHTRYQTTSQNKDTSTLKVVITTGRTHQIRKHFALIGHPVVGDKQYGLGYHWPDHLKNVSRHLLLAYKLEFVHPLTGEKISVTSHKAM